MMCGLPSSGKTYLTNQLVDYFKNTQNRNVIVVSDSAFIKDKNSLYQGTLIKTQRIIFQTFKFCFYSGKDSSNEKELRGSLKSETQKHMSKEDVLILDYLNYIKGYRYELFCISKLYQTPQCVVNKRNLFSFNFN